MWGVVANTGLGILCGHWIETRYSHNNSEYLFLNNKVSSPRLPSLMGHAHEYYWVINS